MEGENARRENRKGEAEDFSIPTAGMAIKKGGSVRPSLIPRLRTYDVT